MKSLDRLFTYAIVQLLVIVPLSTPTKFGEISRKNSVIAFSSPVKQIDIYDDHTVTKLAAPIVISLAITSAAAAISPSTAFAASIESGEVLFSQNCASCHRNGENVMNPKRDLKKETLLKYFGSSGNDVLKTEEIVDWIGKSGQHKRMFFPNVPGGKMTNEDYENAISFIVDQASNDKW